MTTVAERVRAIKIEIPQANAPCKKALTPQDRGVLTCISKGDVRSANDGWAHSTGRYISGPSINRLERAGLVSVTRSAHDARVVINPKGRKLLVNA